MSAPLTSESIQTAVGHIVAGGLGVLALFHPGFKEPAIAQAVVPAVAAFVSAMLAAVYAHASPGVQNTVNRDIAHGTQLLGQAMPFIPAQAAQGTALAEQLHAAANALEGTL